MRKTLSHSIANHHYAKIPRVLSSVMLAIQLVILLSPISSHQLRRRRIGLVGSLVQQDLTKSLLALVPYTVQLHLSIAIPAADTRRTAAVLNRNEDGLLHAHRLWLLGRVTACQFPSKVMLHFKDGKPLKRFSTLIVETSVVRAPNGKALHLRSCLPPWPGLRERSAHTSCRQMPVQLPPSLHR